MQLSAGPPQLPSDDKRWKIVEATARRHGREPHALIETLAHVQESFGYLDETALRFVAACCACPSAALRRCDLLSLLHPEAQGQAHLRGVHRHGLLHQGRARAARRRSRSATASSPGETTADGDSRVLTARCLGSCGLAPAVVLDSAVLGKIAPDRHARHASRKASHHDPRRTAQDCRDGARRRRRSIQHHVRVCIAAGASPAAADQVNDALKKEVAESGMQSEVLVKGVGCMGLCSAGPLVAVERPRRSMYADVTPEEAPEIIRGLDTAAIRQRLHRLPHRRPVLPAAEEDRAGELGRHRSRAHRGLHRARRLRSAGARPSPR